MFIKIIRLNAMQIGCRDLSLPNHFIKSKSLICFDKLNNNLCFWYCIAYHYIKQYDRCTQLANTLYKEFIKKFILNKWVSKLQYKWY